MTDGAQVFSFHGVKDSVVPESLNATVNAMDHKTFGYWVCFDLKLMCCGGQNSCESYTSQVAPGKEWRLEILFSFFGKVIICNCTDWSRKKLRSAVYVKLNIYQLIFCRRCERNCKFHLRKMFPKCDQFGSSSNNTLTYLLHGAESFLRS